MSGGRSRDLESVRRVLQDRRRELERIRDMTAARSAEPQRDTAGESGFDEGDLASEMSEREQALGIADSVEDRLAELDLAFERVEKGTYGICEACGKPIPKARLEARPEARFCVEDQERIARAGS
jgi:RNA polymerase-binding transcription factor